MFDLVPDLTGQVDTLSKQYRAKRGFTEVWRGTRTLSGVEQPVAIKVLHYYEADPAEERRREAKRLRRELKVWRRLNHKNVLPLYGTISNTGPLPSMIYPWVTKGDLTRYLERHRLSLPTSSRLLLLQDVADGMEHLHRNSVIHGDLTGFNVLIDAQDHIICDFGLSIVVGEFAGSPYYTSTMSGSVRWMAPESIAGLTPEGEPPQISKSSDVFSLGRVMYQVLTGNIPFYTLKQDTEVFVGLLHRRRLDRPEGVEDSFWKLMTRCCSVLACHRPTVQDYTLHLQDLAKSTLQDVDEDPSQSLPDSDDDGPGWLSGLLARFCWTKKRGATYVDLYHPD